MPAPEPRTPPSSGRDETDLERWDRNFTELLQELRVAQTGVQILFAFLLTLPFTNRFEQTTELDRGVYVATIVAAAAATALLIAPARHVRPRIAMWWASQTMCCLRSRRKFSRCWATGPIIRIVANVASTSVTR